MCDFFISIYFLHLKFCFFLFLYFPCLSALPFYIITTISFTKSNYCVLFYNDLLFTFVLISVVDCYDVTSLDWYVTNYY